MSTDAAELPALEIARVVGLVDAATPLLTVTTAAGDATTWVAEANAAAAADPLSPWRATLHEQQQRQSGAPVPGHVAAAFVLQWWCEVVGTPIAYAAALGPWVLSPEPRGLGFELATALYPNRIVVEPRHSALVLEPSPDRRGPMARAAYDRLVAPVVRDFAPEVRMGSRQRWGVVDDMWQTAARRAAGAAGRSLGAEPVRTSCCFIFVLPGMHECAACPRGGPRS